jgi:hypothetical protein
LCQTREARDGVQRTVSESVKFGIAIQTSPGPVDKGRTEKRQ